MPCGLNSIVAVYCDGDRLDRGYGQHEFQFTAKVGVGSSPQNFAACLFDRYRVAADSAPGPGERPLSIALRLELQETLISRDATDKPSAFHQRQAARRRARRWLAENHDRRLHRTIQRDIKRFSNPLLANDAQTFLNGCLSPIGSIKPDRLQFTWSLIFQAAGPIRSIRALKKPSTIAA